MTRTTFVAKDLVATADFRRIGAARSGRLDGMGPIERYRVASAEFGRRLEQVGARWDEPTPCPEWTVRQLVNHVVRGNRNYLRLLHGGDAEGFRRQRDADALGTDPVAAFRASVADCAAAFAAPGALERVLDYPLGPVTGRQALSVRTTDTAVHAWDLATALGADDRLDPGIVGWITANLDGIYAGLPETPTAAVTTHRFFGPAVTASPRDAQDRLLHRMGRRTGVDGGPGNR